MDVWPDFWKAYQIFTKADPWKKDGPLMKPNIYIRAPIEGIWEYHGKAYIVVNQTNLIQSSRNSCS